MVPMKLNDPPNGISIRGSELIEGEKAKSNPNF